MTFKELMQRDLDTFFNANEFAEEHDLNGAKCLAILSNSTSKDQLLKPPVAFDNFDSNNITVYCKVSSLKEAPKKNNRFTLDGELYIVQSCSDGHGVLEIVLGVNDGF